MSEPWSDEAIAAKPEVSIKQAYADVYDEILDVLECEATLGPIDETTFKGLAFVIVERLTDMEGA